MRDLGPFAVEREEGFALGISGSNRIWNDLDFLFLHSRFEDRLGEWIAFFGYMHR